LQVGTFGTGGSSVVTENRDHPGSVERAPSISLLRVAQLWP
jgi:hypothetical protein